MSLETFIAWRYLKAKRRQTFISLITIISLAGVALGVTALIVVLAVMSGFQEDMKNRILGVNSHIVLMKFGAPMDDYNEILPKIRATEGVVSAEPFIYSQVMISAIGGVTGCIMRGVDTKEAEKGFLAKSIIHGKLANLDKDDPADPGPGVLLGEELADQMGVLVGDAVKIISPLGSVTPLGSRAPKTSYFTVAGIFKTGMYEYDSKLVYVSLERAQKFLNLEGSVTGIEIMVKDIYQAERIRKEIVGALGPKYWARDWMQMNLNFFTALKLEKIAMFIILTLTVIVAAFNIISTLIMVVMEKTRDIAILKSMGATRRQVMKIFVYQGMVIGILGTLFGLGGGVVLCELLSRYEFIKLPPSVYYITTLPVRMEAFDVALITCSAVLISFLATIYPAWQASRLDPVEALRYE